MAGELYPHPVMAGEHSSLTPVGEDGPRTAPPQQSALSWTGEEAACGRAEEMELLGEYEEEEERDEIGQPAHRASAAADAGAGGRKRRERPHIKFSRRTKWSRFWHAETGHHYFVDPATGRSEWTLPEGDVFEDAPALEQHAAEEAAAAADDGAAESGGAGAGAGAGAAAPSDARADGRLGSGEHPARDQEPAQRRGAPGVLRAGAGSPGAGRGGAGVGDASSADDVICRLCQRKFKSAEQVCCAAWGCAPGAV
jgi:hypothetical protein